MKPKKIFLKECSVVDLLQNDAMTLWESLKINDAVKLNEVEEKRITVEKDETVLGLLSESDSTSLLPYISMGYSDIFQCNISYKSEQNSESLKLKITIKLKKKE